MGLMKRALEDLSDEMGFEGVINDEFLAVVSDRDLTRIAATPRHQERLRQTIAARAENEAVAAIVKLYGEYEPFEFSGGGCPCLRNELATILRNLTLTQQKEQENEHR